MLRERSYLRGISVANVRVNTEPRAWSEKIASIPSPFVAQLLQTVLKNSHNLYAEMLLKRSSNGTYDASFALERALLDERGARAARLVPLRRRLRPRARRSRHRRAPASRCCAG